MPTIFYERCRCPHCKTTLDQIEENTPDCPACTKPLDPQQVWSTRSYAGTLILPPWISAFGWPFLLMIFGFVFFFYAKSQGYVNVYIPGFMVALGLIYFIFKLTYTDK
jgi:hypothetical protein